MKRVAPPPIPRLSEVGETSPATGSALPEPAFSPPVIANIEAAWISAGYEGSADDLIETLRGLTTNYMVEMEWEQVSISPGQVAKYSDDVEAAIRAVELMIRPSVKAPAHLLRHLSPFLREDLDESASRFLANVRSFRSQVGEPKRTSPKDVQGDRRRRFADAFAATFKAKNWPLDTKDNSMMEATFRLCLEAAGDRGQRDRGRERMRGANEGSEPLYTAISNLDRLLADAVKRLLD